MAASPGSARISPRPSRRQSDLEPDADTAGERRKFYGRQHGKTLRASQKRLLRDLLPRLAIPGIARAGQPGRRPLDPAALFGDARPVRLEIGFGGGEHLAHQAAANPQVGFLGCEPFLNGVAMLLARVEAADLANLRIHPGDARDLMDLLPAASLSRVCLLYPDPWPKTRHRSRRFMNPENLASLARIMRQGAELRLATDVPAYARDALRAAAAAAEAFALAEDAARPWPDWHPTRYEAKALREGREPRYLTFRRR